MAKRSFNAMSYTPTAQAVTSALTSSTYQAICGGNATQILNVIEIYEGGQASASSINLMCFARASTIATTPTALAAPNSDGPMHGATAALASVPLTFTAATTGPLRSAAVTDARLNLSLNTFGGIVRWVAAPGEEWTIVGAGATTGESILSCYTGGSAGLMGSHIVYEPF